jgi:hypothetical protein
MIEMYMSVELLWQVSWQLVITCTSLQRSSLYTGVHGTKYHTSRPLKMETLSAFETVHPVTWCRVLEVLS